MTAMQTPFLLRAIKFTLVLLVSYASASVVAASTLGILTGTYGHHSPFGLALLVGMFAFPLAPFLKLVMHINGLDGALSHSIAGLIVGFVAGVLLAEARKPHWIICFALAGMGGALAYLGVRNLGRRLVRW